MTTQKHRALTFKALHHAERPLLLFNAWDIASARAIAATAPSIATSSGAVAAAHGFADGEAHPLDSVVAFVRRLCAAVSVPVSVDFEAGYSDTPEGAASAVEAILAAGAVGINLEDGLVGGERKLADPQANVAKIVAIRKVATRLDVPLFINARTDVFMLGPNDQRAALAETIERASIYANAGADGLFVPGLNDLGLIAELTATTTLPVNIMAVGESASVGELTGAGVARISCGAWPMVEVMRWTARAAGAFVRHGIYPSTNSPAS
jgi:2-methylisocitrate lyase-like PEP mutase family enzyme